MTLNRWNQDAVVLLLAAGLASAQSTTRPKYMDRAVVQHTETTATVTANYPTPLFQAIEGVRQEYGWLVNSEEAPCYGRFDVVDDTSPKWRAAHPGAEGVTRKAGGPFSSVFPEPKATEPSTEETALRKVVEDYNATVNPGKYVLRIDPAQHFTVVGTQVRDDTGILQTVTPILDTPISIEVRRRSAFEALDSLILALSSASGKRVILMSLPNNLFRDTEVSIKDRNVPARQILLRLLEATKRPLQYDLGFDPDHSSVYILNVSVAARMQADDSDRRILIPIDRLR